MHIGFDVVVYVPVYSLPYSISRLIYLEVENKKKHPLVHSQNNTWLKLLGPGSLKRPDKLVPSNKPPNKKPDIALAPEKPVSASHAQPPQTTAPTKPNTVSQPGSGTKGPEMTQMGNGPQSIGVKGPAQPQKIVTSQPQKMPNGTLPSDKSSSVKAGKVYQEQANKIPGSQNVVKELAASNNNKVQQGGSLGQGQKNIQQQQQMQNSMQKLGPHLQKNEQLQQNQNNNAMMNNKMSNNISRNNGGPQSGMKQGQQQQQQLQQQQLKQQQQSHNNKMIDEKIGIFETNQSKRKGRGSNIYFLPIGKFIKEFILHFWIRRIQEHIFIIDYSNFTFVYLKNAP